MKKWYYILAALLLGACVGQKEDPEPEPVPDPVVDPEGGAAEGTIPFHRVLALEFTATWCQYCPNMTEALVEASAARPGRIVDIAVHQYDELSNPDLYGIVDYFKAGSFPQMVLDWDAGTMFNEQRAQRILDYVDATVDKPTCNIALECSYADQTLNAKVTVKADEAAAYSVTALLVQDLILVEQAGYGSDYPCMGVLRQALGSGTDGESLGNLQKDEEKSYTFQTALDTGDNPESDFRVVAFVRKDGRVVNAIEAGLNEKSDYAYEKDN